MIFHRFEDYGLAHFSYVLGSERSGEVVVVDPRRDIDPYLALRVSAVRGTAPR